MDQLQKIVFDDFKGLTFSSPYSEHRLSLISGVHVMKQAEHNML